MDRSDFNYELPPELIAQAPPPARGASRLLVLDGATGRFEDSFFADLPELLGAGDLLVLNDTRVLPARILGRKPSGGRVEILLERITGARTARAQIGASRAPKPGAELLLPGEAAARVERRAGELFELVFDRDLAAYLEAHGQVPLPPYIERAPGEEDADRYQTVYARRPGAVAAPTAGLHFDEALLEALGRRGVQHVFLTLHVGAGTFAPVRCRRVEDHRLHAEWLEVPEGVCAAVRRTRERGGRIVAVGTTSVRALESAARKNGLQQPFEGETELFIYPGYRFQVVDVMVTNFHLPESSLLMLVSAFAGREHVLAAYRHAVRERYRFFSYGDAMWITPSKEAVSRS
jgi:S-adenosylmethionine:tRNA ribosyltransferase-isomerase